MHIYFIFIYSKLLNVPHENSSNVRKSVLDEDHKQTNPQFVSFPAAKVAVYNTFYTGYMQVGLCSCDIYGGFSLLFHMILIYT